jgi:hypothetical protein
MASLRSLLCAGLSLAVFPVPVAVQATERVTVAKVDFRTVRAPQTTQRDWYEIGIVASDPLFAPAVIRRRC